jgi:coenzyme F420-reducing hydrogenase delta subunit
MGIATSGYECFECAAKDKQMAEFSDHEIGLNKEITVLNLSIADMERKLEDYKKVADRLHKESVELQNLKAKARFQVSQKIANDYFMLEGGKLPILWVNAASQDLFPAHAFTQMANQIKRINQDIDLIILTYGVDSLQQMDDEGLNSLGLYRK